MKQKNPDLVGIFYFTVYPLTAFLFCIIMSSYIHFRIKLWWINKNGVSQPRLGEATISDRSDQLLPYEAIFRTYSVRFFFY